LGRWHLDEATRISYTDEIAQETSLEIVHAHYPYDCEFDAWACKITHHTTSKYMKRHGSSTVLYDVDLADVADWFQGSGEAAMPNPEDQYATRQFLLNAIEQLSENQKIVIWQFYFEGAPLPKIAKVLDVSVNTIYKRHFDALTRLRKIIGENQYKDE
jgi:RNA polymerase sigma factor (sigma-70 family)